MRLTMTSVTAPTGACPGRTALASIGRPRPDFRRRMTFSGRTAADETAESASSHGFPPRRRRGVAFFFWRHFLTFIRFPHESAHQRRVRLRVVS